MTAGVPQHFPVLCPTLVPSSTLYDLVEVLPARGEMREPRWLLLAGGRALPSCLPVVEGVGVRARR